MLETGHNTTERSRGTDAYCTESKTKLTETLQNKITLGFDEKPRNYDYIYETTSLDGVNNRPRTAAGQSPPTSAQASQTVSKSFSKQSASSNLRNGNGIHRDDRRGGSEEEWYIWNKVELRSKEKRASERQLGHQQRAQQQ